MESIFHEKQEGLLCAQHCLNALLQGEFFTAVDLATLAQQMDDEERHRMSEAGEDSDEYRRFLQAGSQNMDDSGYFSVQVIAAALRCWDLELLRYTSSDAVAVQARTHPAGQRAFICNYRDHWFTIRRLGRQWFNLNSLLTGPELLSDSYLSEFLAQLIQEEYSIFVVLGALPGCAADRLLQDVTVTQAVKPRLISEKLTIERLAGDDPELRAAIEASLDGRMDGGGGGGVAPAAAAQSEEAQLQAALAASLSPGGNYGASGRPLPATAAAAAAAPAPAEPDDDEQLRAAIALSLEAESDHTGGAQAGCAASAPTHRTSRTRIVPIEMEGGGRARAAAAAAAESSADAGRQPPPDTGTVRARRQAFLDRLEANKQAPS